MHLLALLQQLLLQLLQQLLDQHWLGDWQALEALPQLLPHRLPWSAVNQSLPVCLTCPPLLYGKSHGLLQSRLPQHVAMFVHAMWVCYISRHRWWYSNELT